MSRYFGAAAWQALSMGLSAALSVALTVWLARTLGADGFGRYGIALAALHVVAAVADGGWSTWLTREAAAREGGAQLPPRAWYWTALVCSVAVVALLDVVHDGSVAFAVVATGALIVASNRYSGVLRGTRRFAVDAGFQFSGRVISAAAILVTVSVFVEAPRGSECAAASSPQCTALLAGLFLAWAASLAISLLLFRRWRVWHRLPPREAVGRQPPLRGTMGAALMLGVIEGVNGLLMRGDVIVVDQLARAQVLGAGDDQLAVWAIAARISEFALLVVAPVGNLMIGIFHRPAYTSGRRRLTYMRLMAGAFGVGVAVWLLVWIGGAALQRVLFGGGYAATSFALGWATLPVVLLPFNAIALQLVLATTQPGRALRALVAAVLIYALTLLIAGLLAASGVLAVQAMTGPVVAWASFAAQCVLAAMCMRALGKGGDVDAPLRIAR